jgi:Domain of unknown function (DUF4893)
MGAAMEWPMRFFLTSLMFLVLTLPVRADGTLPKIITSDDAARLKQFDAVKEKALAEARAQGDAADVKILDAAMAGSPLTTADDFDATGKWLCRTIKMGGGLPLVVYTPFKCSISDDGAGWFLKKLSGSQRTQGRFYTESETRMIYLGAGHIYDEPPRKYGDDPKENQVAVVERLGKNRLVLQFPKPVYESDFDLLVLER